MSNRDAGQPNSYGGLTPEDITALSNYPSLGKVLDKNSTEFVKMKEKLTSTFQQYERVILRGTSEDSTKAKQAAAAIRVALDFLEMVKQKF